MALSNTHIIPEIKKLLKELEEEASYLNIGHNVDYVEGVTIGIEYCIEKIKKILDTA